MVDWSLKFIARKPGRGPAAGEQHDQRNGTASGNDRPGGLRRRAGAAAARRRRSRLSQAMRPAGRRCRSSRTTPSSGVSRSSGCGRSGAARRRPSSRRSTIGRLALYAELSAQPADSVARDSWRVSGELLEEVRAATSDGPAGSFPASLAARQAAVASGHRARLLASGRASGRVLPEPWPGGPGRGARRAGRRR